MYNERITSLEESAIIKAETKRLGNTATVADPILNPDPPLPWTHMESAAES